MREHQKAFENQKKQLVVMKKQGKSGKQAVEEVKSKMATKQAKTTKGKKGSATIGDEGININVFHFSQCFIRPLT